MRIEHATLDGKVIVSEVPDEPASVESVEATNPTLEGLAAALQVVAERVGMSKVEVETLVRQSRSPALPSRA
jgi:hypothetical protein